MPIRNGRLPGDTDRGGSPIPFGLGHGWHAAAHGTPLAPSYVVREILPTVPARQAPGRSLGIPAGDRSLPRDANGGSSLVPLILTQAARHRLALALETDGSGLTPAATVTADSVD